MFDASTEALLREMEKACRDVEFYQSYKDMCIAARLALMNIRGRGVRIRPSLLRLTELSDIKTASYVLAELKRLVGPVADAESIRRVAAEYVYKRVVEALCGR
jgi:hypothetical protein